MGGFKKIFKKSLDPLKLFTPDRVKNPTINTPAQQLERQEGTSPDDITMGTDDEGGVTKGKRALLRPASGSSLGGL